MVPLVGSEYASGTTEATVVYCPTSIINIACGDFNELARSHVFLLVFLK